MPELEYVKHGVKYEVDGETFTYEALDEDDARKVAESTGGTLGSWKVFETCWADLERV